MNDSIYQRIDTNPRFGVGGQARAFRLDTFFDHAWPLRDIHSADRFPAAAAGRAYQSRFVRDLGYPDGYRTDPAAFILTGLYVRRANGEFDSLNQEILKEAQQ